MPACHIRVAMGALTLLSVQAHAAAPLAREGLWEITTRTEISGYSAGVPPIVVKQCLTARDLNDPRALAPNATPVDAGCIVSDYTAQGSTATWALACKGRFEAVGRGSVAYQTNSYSGRQQMSVRLSGQTATVISNYAGRLLGPCPR